MHSYVIIFISFHNYKGHSTNPPPCMTYLPTRDKFPLPPTPLVAVALISTERTEQVQNTTQKESENS